MLIPPLVRSYLEKHITHPDHTICVMGHDSIAVTKGEKYAFTQWCTDGIHSSNKAFLAMCYANRNMICSGAPVQEVAKVLLNWLDNYDESSTSMQTDVRTTELSLYGVDYDLR